MSTENQSTSIVIGPVRFSYAHVWEPYAGKDKTQKPKYQVSIIVPKGNKPMIEKIEAAIEAAKQDGKARKWGNKIPPKLDISFKDSDIEKPEDEAYANSFYISAKSDKAPAIVDKARNPIIEKDQFYSGCWGYVSINFYPYNEPKNGIACGLNHLMKTKDDEALGGARVSAEEAFADVVVDEDDDFLN